jgi:hypothetical protein
MSRQLRVTSDNARLYFVLIQSNIVLAGLPMLIGSLFSANLSGALMDPAPGNSPPEVGHVLSSFVTRNWHPGLRIRYCMAFEILVKLMFVSHPHSTAPTSVSMVKFAREKGSKVRSAGS